MQARKGNDPLPHPPLSCSPSRFSVSLQLNLVSSLRGFRFGPVLFVLWRPLDPGSASPQSGFLQHHRLLREVGMRGCGEEGGTGLGVVAKGCGSARAFSPIHWHVFPSSKFCKILQSPPENGGRCRERGGAEMAWALRSQS